VGLPIREAILYIALTAVAVWVITVLNFDLTLKKIARIVVIGLLVLWLFLYMLLPALHLVR
jgi:hypothetical protein